MNENDYLIYGFLIFIHEYNKQNIQHLFTNNITKLDNINMVSNVSGQFGHRSSSAGSFVGTNINVAHTYIHYRRNEWVKSQ